MLPCSIGSLEWRQREQIQETCQTAAQGAKGGEEWGRARRQQPGKEGHEAEEHDGREKRERETREKAQGENGMEKERMKEERRS